MTILHLSFVSLPQSMTIFSRIYGVENKIYWIEKIQITFNFSKNTRIYQKYNRVLKR